MKVPVTLDWAGFCALGGLLIHCWLPYIFSRFQRFVILLGFWMAFLLVDEHDVTLLAKIRHESHRQLILLHWSFCRTEIPFLPCALASILLQALGLQTTSTVKRAYCTEIYWGKIQRTCHWPMKSKSFRFL